MTNLPYRERTENISLADRFALIDDILGNFVGEKSSDSFSVEETMSGKILSNYKTLKEAKEALKKIMLEDIKNGNYKINKYTIYGLKDDNFIRLFRDEFVLDQLGVEEDQFDWDFNPHTFLSDYMGFWAGKEKRRKENEN